MSLSIKQSEYEERLAGLAEHLLEHKLTGAVLFDPYYVLYYAGFAFAPTERPIAFVLNAEGRGGMLVPRLEREHAQANASVDHVADYPEYPAETHPMESLRNLLDEMGVDGPFGADQDGYPWVLGYRGPSLTELTGTTPQKITAFVEDQMAVKSPAEIELIRVSSKWGNLAHVLLQQYTRPGLSESEVSRRASTEASLAMLDAIGAIYRAQSFLFDGASAGYRGQIGRNAAIPHALANNIVFQDTAFEAIKPGARCSDVDRAVRRYYDEHDLWEYWKHHVGHCIGLRYHEGPFFNIGDDTEIKPGMVFTVEPGLYAAGLGGFRHSDTVAVTEDGIEFLTYYPRDLASLTLPS